MMKADHRTFDMHIFVFQRTGWTSGDSNWRMLYAVSEEGDRTNMGDEGGAGDTGEESARVTRPRADLASADLRVKCIFAEAAC